MDTPKKRKNKKLTKKQREARNAKRRTGKPMGRPRWDGQSEETVLRNLRYAFDIGCTDREACIHANIGQTVFYDYCKEHPEFAEEKELRKEKPILLARKVIMDAITLGDNETREFNSRWYLERKQKGEFSLRTESLHGEDPNNKFTSLADALKALELSKTNKDEPKA